MQMCQLGVEKIESFVDNQSYAQLHNGTANARQMQLLNKLVTGAVLGLNILHLNFHHHFLHLFPSLLFSHFFFFFITRHSCTGRYC